MNVLEKAATATEQDRALVHEGLEIVTLLLAPIGTRTLATQFWSESSAMAYGAAAPYARDLNLWRVDAAGGGAPPAGAAWAGGALSVFGLLVIEAIFESVSGLTTTGATMVSQGIDDLPRSINYYRMQLHWLGGMGIIVLAVAILPMLRGDLASLNQNKG